jgi:hypothetical protein
MAVCFAARNPAFAFLTDAAEDIYSVSDGTPYHYELFGLE